MKDALLKEAVRLSPIDHLLTAKLGVRKWVRYCDDILIYDDDPGRLRDALAQLTQRALQMRLRLHEGKTFKNFAAAMKSIALGFAVAFIAAVIVVRWVLGYISRHGFALFGWWRIVVGLAAWAALLMGF